MHAFEQSCLERLCARSRLEGHSTLGQCRCKSDIRFEPIADLPPKRLCGAHPWTSVGAGPSNLFVQLVTRNVVDGRGRYPAFWLIIKRVGVIATLRRHGRHSAVRTIGAIICRSPPVSVIVVAVVLSIASSCACNERTNHQCQCCDILKYPAHDWALFFGSLLVRQPKVKSFYLLGQLKNSCSQIDNPGPMSLAWYCVNPAGDVRFGFISGRSRCKVCFAKSTNFSRAGIQASLIV